MNAIKSLISKWIGIQGPKLYAKYNRRYRKTVIRTNVVVAKIRPVSYKQRFSRMVSNQKGCRRRSSLWKCHEAEHDERRRRPSTSPSPPTFQTKKSQQFKKWGNWILFVEIISLKSSFGICNYFAMTSFLTHLLSICCVCLLLFSIFTCLGLGALCKLPSISRPPNKLPGNRGLPLLLHLGSLDCWRQRY